MDSWSQGGQRRCLRGGCKMGQGHSYWAATSVLYEECPVQSTFAGPQADQAERGSL